MTPVIPDFILVIPAKAGIHTDSPPEPYCPMPPWPCHPREGRDPPLALDSRLRGNDDLRAWERVVVLSGWENPVLCGFFCFSLFSAFPIPLWVIHS
ncbi:hypothetical protein [Endozoicomonas sp. ALC020]|uniref:hypothetical protein n=1 Tax=unclassified Endozoicomonas TaxID=2644528 RepID=UPI003BAE26E1